MEVKAAVEAMGRRDIWLAAVMMALKMWEGSSAEVRKPRSEAESELASA